MDTAHKYLNSKREGGVTQRAISLFWISTKCCRLIRPPQKNECTFMNPSSIQGKNLPKVFFSVGKVVSPIRLLHIQLHEELGMHALSKQVEEKNPKLSNCYLNNERWLENWWLSQTISNSKIGKSEREKNALTGLERPGGNPWKESLRRIFQ